MARKITPRKNYMQDAIVMRRTAEAVQMDPTASQGWKTEVCAHLQAAMRLFLERDSDNANQATS